MEIVIVKDRAMVGQHAAGLIERTVLGKPAAVLGFATGSSPLPVYEALEGKDLDWTDVSGFALDEYVDIPVHHAQSYVSVIRREVVDRLGLDERRVRVPDGRARDLDVAARLFDEAIREAGGVDLQLLGIGTNGHVGFNEPGSSFASRTRVTALTASTREANSRFFDSVHQVPMHCITQGLGTILEARRLVLVADGTRKADAVARAVEGPVTSKCPASAIQLHPCATIVIDELAAAKLTLRDYYRYSARRPARAETGALL
ncbi:glucosamine-6-phosphate deaminase [Arthrobacter sp. ISL-48]|uniref:glucosamine-6-phosphate deaminase n=1 Tax=Arthrobacter sp. ISL-48 TaxID=2819110 RepID=UPI001BE5DA72|nr:glucosamine-6-phosphate deaminase [Arthrobacter sp. ISL-48]MBT2532579.1 glucosamine-6-phosphate deaminase [Arthrobacter sp. ISL-48]